jgi:hypothetical protein
MKHKYFYSHLFETSDISLELAEMDLDQNERIHLVSLVEANIHSEVIKTVLSELPTEDKKQFLSNMLLKDHEKIWEHLNKKIKDAEEKIRQTIVQVNKELFEDIKKVKSNKGK